MVSKRRSQKTVSSEQNKDNVATTADDACDNAPRDIQDPDAGNDLIEKSFTSRVSRSKKVGQEKRSNSKKIIIQPESDICTNDSIVEESSCEAGGSPALEDQAECSENVSYQIDTNPSEKSTAKLITETNSEDDEKVGNTNSDAVNSPLKFIIDSKSASQKLAKLNVGRTTPKTVAELEEQIMGGSSDDDSDDEAFSFLNGGKCKVEDAPNTDDSMFMIDRQAGYDMQTATSSTNPEQGPDMKPEIDPEHRHTIM